MSQVIQLWAKQCLRSGGGGGVLSPRPTLSLLPLGEKEGKKCPIKERSCAIYFYNSKKLLGYHFLCQWACF